MEKIRVGLIGCGGRQRVHINALLQMEDVEIAALAEPIEERRISAADATGAKRIYKNHTELLDKESKDSLDALFISVEPTAHDDMELRAIEMGIPFMVEKPMTLDLDLADKIAAGIRKKNLITAVGFQDRYLDLIQMMKEEIPRHKAGGIIRGSWIGGIPGVWWWQKKSTCGGQLVEQNIHLLDGLRYLFGEPLSVYAVNATGIVEPGVDASPEYDTDDYSICLFRFKNNFTASLASGCYCKGIQPHNGLLVILNDIILDYRLRNNLIIKTKNKTVDIMRGNDQTFDLDRAFIDAVKTGDRSLVRSPYEDALKSLKVGFAANRSMETGEVIYFEEEE
ncbi:MAG: Gfo/Idh/MocA family protein [Caldicoprobacterales bacterium]